MTSSFFEIAQAQVIDGDILVRRRVAEMIRRRARTMDIQGLLLIDLMAVNAKYITVRLSQDQPSGGPSKREDFLRRLRKAFDCAVSGNKKVVANRHEHSLVRDAWMDA